MQGEEELGGGSGGSSPPIIIKKISRGWGHHGGAWKVAFADFVTAMMALFMVLWLMNANENEKEAISAYFHDPKGFAEKWGSSQPAITISKDELEELADKIQHAMKEMPELEKLRDNIVATVTGDGLRIELLESEKGMFFQSGSPSPSGSGHTALQTIGQELAKLPNEIILEGHTDSIQFQGRKDYSNWKLSVDRANAARRILTEAGLGTDRIVQVRGFADVNLRSPDAPEDPSNRRISLIIKYRDAQPVPASEGQPVGPVGTGNSAGPSPRSGDASQ
jgi:chemotaxis protein MotB